ncbi:septal ring lytic transglycosylase RlpA family protein [Desulfovibrio sp. OttesenSCG-928-M16]|nr:septal ring lytic transglycosylase RlpA family protein [Desulfovibrio sp. OttesenSCG-928-M16]
MPVSTIKQSLAKGAFLCVARPLTLVLCILCLALPAQASSPSLNKGRASWYGTTAHGKMTANGEIYNREALTAAHKSIAFGTVLRVFNLKNGRHVLVRVNDRGPFVEGREVDVSLRAAESLRMIKAGVVTVAIQVVSDKKGRALNSENAFYVHITNDEGLISSRILAGEMAQRTGLQVRSMRIERNAYQGYAVVAGPFASFTDAQKSFLRLEAKDLAVLGIVEGPVAGNALPVFDVQKRRQTGKPPSAATQNYFAPLRQLADFSKLEFGQDADRLITTLAGLFLPGFVSGPLLLTPSASLSAYISSL